MSEKRGPLDLVGRAAARINLGKFDRAPLRGEPSAPPPPLPEIELPTHSPMPAANGSDSDTPVQTTTPPGNRSATGGGHVEIDFVSLQKDGYLTPQNQSSLIAEEFRLIKRPLLRIAFDSRGTENGLGHVIMVTSCHPDDGKTFVSTNLSISMASERDLFVLVVDGDIRRRGLSRRLGVADRPGIMDVLLNPAVSISDVMIRTNVPNLAIVPAGKAINGATELFASQRMTKLIQDIANRYKDRIIVFDAPPVLAATEPGVLAAHMGQIAFVVKSGETSKRSIAGALRLLDVCPNIHFVINRVTKVAGDDRFWYYDY